MPFLPVDTAVVVRVGPAIDDTDFKSREAVAYNADGINVDLHESTVAGTKGAFTTTAITPEDPAGGVGNRWTSIGEGYHELEITAAQNNTEGELQVVALATGVLHFESAVYTVVPVAVFNSLVAGSDTLPADVTQIGGVAQSATDLKDFADTGYDPTTHKVAGVVLADTTTTNSDMVAAAPSAAAIRTEMEGAGTKLTAVHAVIPATAPPTNTQFEARTIAAADYGTAANQTTLLNRIGAFTGTGLNTILGFLKALMSKAGGLTPSDVGGTYDNTTDSVEAIRDTAPLGTAMRGTDSAALASVCTEERLARLDAAVTTRSSHSAANVRTEMDTNSTKLANLDAAVTTRSSHSAANVWAVETRTLSTFGTLVADVAAAVWGAVARTLTSLSGLGHATEAKQDTAQTTLNAMKGADGKCVISTDEQDRSTTLHVNAKKLNGETPYNIPPGGAFM